MNVVGLTAGDSYDSEHPAGVTNRSWGTAVSNDDSIETTVRWSYRPGAWFGIFGENATVVLPSSEKHRVAALWELVDDGAGFDEVLDALIASGLRDLPGFVLISFTGSATQVVLRGAARATFTAAGETVEVEGAAATTWVERSLSDVTRTEITLDADEVEGENLTIGSGLVRLARVESPPYVDRVEQPEVEQPRVAPEPVEPERSLANELLGAPTEQFTVEPAPEGSPGPQADLDHDGLTRTGAWDSPQFAREQPGIPGQPQAPDVTARPVARLVFSSGETIDVDRAILVGRAPEARRSTTDQPRLVSVPSPHQEISSTHLEIRPGSGADHGTAVVTDLGSTNGTVLVQPGLPPEDLPPGIAVQLLPGAIIDLGDGVTVQVTIP